METNGAKQASKTNPSKSPRFNPGRRQRKSEGQKRREKKRKTQTKGPQDNRKKTQNMDSRMTGKARLKGRGQKGRPTVQNGFVQKENRQGKGTTEKKNIRVDWERPAASKKGRGEHWGDEAGEKKCEGGRDGIKPKKKMGDGGGKKDPPRSGEQGPRVKNPQWGKGKERATWPLNPIQEQETG